MERADPMAYANDLLHKALHASPDAIMGVVGAMTENTDLSQADMKKVIKQVFEVIKVRNTLALLLFQTHVLDPRQFPLFGDELTPKDFESSPHAR